MNERGSFAAGDGCRLAYRIDGPADAAPLLLLNSLGTDAGMWDRQVEAFAGKRRVLRLDTRGHGGSDVPPGAYSLDRLGRDVVELLDTLGLAVVDVCGLSLGGMVAQWLGYRHPERVRRLVLANTAAYIGPPASWQARIAAVQAEGMPAVADAVLERWFTPRFRATADAWRPVEAALRATAADGYVGCCAALRDADLRPTARLVQAPALVIGGSRDPATPLSDAWALIAALPNAAPTVLDAAHLSNIERADEFNGAVLGFLEAG